MMEFRDIYMIGICTAAGAFTIYMGIALWKIARDMDK